MSRRVRMSSEVRDWLAALLAEDERMGRIVGEAVTVLFETEAAAPLIVAAESMLRAEHPNSALDHSYQRQLELLQAVRRSVADLATARNRLKPRISEDDDGRRRYEELVAEEEEAVLSSQRLQARVDAFRTRKEAVKAGYTAALIEQELHEAFPDSDMPGPANMASARAAIDDLLRTAADLERQLGADATETLSELRLADLRLLFAAESPDTAVLLVVGAGAEDWGEWYDEALPLARAELHKDDLTAYDRAAFLAEYFPGQETEIQAAATRLIEANR